MVWALFVLTMCAAKVSGSSVGVYGDDAPAAGMARTIRSDEFLQRTPLVIRQTELDLPDTLDVGMGTHSAGVLSDLPVGAWTAALRPQTLPYLILDVERAFAFEWWIVMTAPFIGVYVLMLLLTKRVGLSVLTGSAVAVSPAGVWWAIPAMGLSIGWGAIFAAALLAAGRATRRWVTVSFALVAGYALAALALLLYVPWIVPMALLFGAVVVGAWINRAERPPRTDLLIIVGTAFTTAALLVAGFIVREHEAIAAIVGSAYPGARRSESGTGNLVTLLSAPFDYFAGQRERVSVNGTFQSEVAAGLMLSVAVLIGDGTLWRWRRSSDPIRRIASMVMVTQLAFFAWCILPVPSLFGRLLGLDLVPAPRMYLPLAVGSLLLVALAAHVHRTDDLGAVDRDRHRHERVRLASGVVVAGTAWAGLQYRVDGLPISRTWVVIIAALVGAMAYLLLTGRALIGLTAVVVFTAFSTLRVNPVQIGLEPLLQAPLLEQIDQVRADVPDGDGSWLLVGFDIDGYGALAASGVPLTSGVSLYADPETWTVLDPTRAAEVTWNRYGLVLFDVQPGVEPPAITNPQDDIISVSIGACRAELTRLGVDWVVSANPIVSTCLVPALDEPTTGDQYWIYELVDP